MPKIKPTLLVGSPTLFEYVEATNMVHWEVDDGKCRKRCMPEPMFRETIYAGLALIKAIDTARSAGRNAPVPMRRRNPPQITHG